MDLKLLKKIKDIVIQKKKATLPILECFYIDQDFLYMTNLNIAVKIRHHFPLTSGVLLPILIDAGQFIRSTFNIRAPWGIKSLSDKKVCFVSPSGEFTIPCNIDALEFTNVQLMPVPPQSGVKNIKERMLYPLSSYELSRIIMAKGFTADDELRPVMMKVFADEEHIVASDAHKLIYLKTTKKRSEPVLFPIAVIRLLELTKDQDYELWVVDRHYVLRGQDVTIWWRIEDAVKNPAFDSFMEGKNYPKWQNVVPKEKKGRIIIFVKETLQALSSIAFASNPASRLIRLTITDTRLSMAALDFDTMARATESVDIWNETKVNITFGFRLNFINQILNVFKDRGYSQVTMEYNDKTHSFVFNNEVLLMPMMITEPM